MVVTIEPGKASLLVTEIGDCVRFKDLIYPGKLGNYLANLKVNTN